MTYTYITAYDLAEELNDAIAQRDAEIAALHAKVRTVAEGYADAYGLSSGIVQDALNDMGIKPRVKPTWVIEAVVHTSASVKADTYEEAYQVALDMLPMPVVVDVADVLNFTIYEA